MTPEHCRAFSGEGQLKITRKPNGSYLIESSPSFAKRRACLRLQRISILPVTIFCAAIAGYRDELEHMRNAAPMAAKP